MNFITKTYDQLTKEELYDLLRLRSEVFVVEQDCVYQDIDLKDKKAVHLLGYYEGELIAYSRIFKPGDYFKNASIGRVLVAKKYRLHQKGEQLMNYSIDQTQQLFEVDTIEISAQQYLEKFYTKLGFKTLGEPYLEDGIPHLKMLRS